MKVRYRQVSPLTLAGLGVAGILALIGAALHPPTSTSDRSFAPPDWSPATVDVVTRPGENTTSTPTGALRAANRIVAIIRLTEAETEATATATATENRTPATTNTSGTARQRRNSTGTATGDGVRVNCPTAEDQLPAVPPSARTEVTANLTELAQQISDADTRLAHLAAHPVADPAFIDNTILGPLRDRRVATLDRITIAIGRTATRPEGLTNLAPCTLRD